MLYLNMEEIQQVNEQETNKINVWAQIAFIVGGVLAILAGIIFGEALSGWVILGFIGVNIVFIVSGGIMILAGAIMLIFWYMEKKKAQE